MIRFNFFIISLIAMANATVELHPICEYPEAIKITPFQRTESQMDAIEVARRENVRRVGEKVAFVSQSCPKTFNVVAITLLQKDRASTLIGHTLYEVSESGVALGLMSAGLWGADQHFDFFVYQGFEQRYGQIILSLVDRLYSAGGVLNNPSVNAELYPGKTEFLLTLSIYKDAEQFVGWDSSSTVDSGTLSYIQSPEKFPNTVFKIPRDQWSDKLAQRTIIKKKFDVTKIESASAAAAAA